MGDSLGPTMAQVAGCLLGGALGDALALPFEGQGSGSRVLNVPATLLCSDDTQMTLATCRSLCHKSAVDAAHVAATLLRSHREEAFRGVGASTLEALQGLEAGGHWASVGSKGFYAGGNGAAVRSAPLAFWVDPTDYFERKLIRDVAWITHHHDEAYAGALAMVLGVWAAWRGLWCEEASLAAVMLPELPGCLLREHLEDIAGAPPIQEQAVLTERLQQIGTTGFAATSVPAAIMAADAASSIGLLAAFEAIICAGGDTDSIASMCGQLYGARYGREALPEESQRLPCLQEIEQLATCMVEGCAPVWKRR